MGELGMFALGSVLLPGMALPLHVFEDRYRALMRDCLAADREFGVVLIERGSEVGGGDIRAMVATVAHIVEADELNDGRWSVLAVGTRRIRVRGWLPDVGYPRAEVEDWPDEPGGDLNEQLGQYQARVADLRRILTIISKLGAQISPEVDLSDDPSVGTHQIAVLAPLGALDRQRILTAPGVDDRLRLLDEFLADQELMLRAQLEDL